MPEPLKHVFYINLKIYYNLNNYNLIYFTDLRFCKCWSSLAKDSTDNEEVEPAFEEAVDFELERLGYLTGLVLPENFKTKINSSNSSVLKGTFVVRKSKRN